MKVYKTFILFEKPVRFKNRYKKVLDSVKVKSSGEDYIETEPMDFYGFLVVGLLHFDEGKLMRIDLKMDNFQFNEVCEKLDVYFDSKKTDTGRRYTTKKIWINVNQDGITIEPCNAVVVATPFNEFLRYTSLILDKITLTAFVSVLLIGLYMTYDTAYVFYNSSPTMTRFRVLAEKKSENRPLTAGYVAWLKLDDTNVDYPVMQGKTNSEFLNKDPYGEYSLSGSIFLDSRLQKNFSDSYCLVYGHHMTNKYMFGALDDYYDIEFFKAHSVGSLKVEDKLYRLDIFALADDDAHTDVIFNPEGSGELLKYLKATAKIYFTPINDHILAMSTCKDPGSTARTIVFATMTEIEDNTEEHELTPEEIVKQQQGKQYDLNGEE